MADDGPIAVLRGDADAIERLGERADLVELDENRVRRAGLDAAAQALDVGHEEVVADDLNARADPLGEKLPALPVVLGKAILDRHDGIFARELFVDSDELVASRR